jgi:septal ring-binding cell division protein DamX
MLTRVNGELFRARIGETIRIRAVATNNPGSNIASFEYAGAIVPNDAGSTSQCRFKVVPSIEQFQAAVVFAPGAGADAQYDLFELDSNGDPQPLDESVTPDASVSEIGFGILGQPAAPVAKGVAKKAAKKVAKKAVKKAAKKTAVKKAAKKTVKKAAKKAKKTKSARKRAKKSVKKSARKKARNR